MTKDIITNNIYIKLSAKAIDLIILLESKWIINKELVWDYTIKLIWDLVNVDYKIKANLIIGLLEIAVKNKLYHEVIDFSKYVIENRLSTYELMITDYFILIWASYQEIWNLESANKYFDKYIICIEHKRKTDEEYEKQIVNFFKDPKLINWKWLISLMLVIQSLNELWLDYITPENL